MSTAPVPWRCWLSPSEWVEGEGGPGLWLLQGGHREPWSFADGPLLRMQCGLGGHWASREGCHFWLAPGASAKVKLHRQQPGGGAHRAPCGIGIAFAWAAFPFRNREGFGCRVVNHAFEDHSETSPALQARPSLSQHLPGFLTLSASLR